MTDIFQKTMKASGTVCDKYNHDYVVLRHYSSEPIELTSGYCNKKGARDDCLYEVELFLTNVLMEMKDEAIAFDFPSGEPYFAPQENQPQNIFDYAGLRHISIEESNEDDGFYDITVFLPEDFVREYNTGRDPDVYRLMPLQAEWSIAKLDKTSA